ncbi:MAG: YicC family protein [Syntrophobacteraceae bacterium]|nr:YicC family protein [Syntrophobacteraceae bacterium]
MIRSMTAFGRTQKEADGLSITVEMRTLNGRSLDVSLRLPKHLLEFEDMLRKQIGRSLRRGRIEVFVQVESATPAQTAPRISIPLALHYWEQLMEIHRQLPGTEPPTLDHLLKIPYIYEAQNDTPQREQIQSVLAEAMDEVIAQIVSMRNREGDALRVDCLDRLRAIEADLNTIDGRKDLVGEELRRRLLERMSELLGDASVDENRVLQEVACLAERSDINEEIVRLRSHLRQFRSLIEPPAESDGRKLDFMTQELHRETNTIGCKTGELDLIQAVVRMKGEIAKLKEQVQNIE